MCGTPQRSTRISTGATRPARLSDSVVGAACFAATESAVSAIAEARTTRNADAAVHMFMSFSHVGRRQRGSRTSGAEQPELRAREALGRFGQHHPCFSQAGSASQERALGARRRLA